MKKMILMFALLISAVTVFAQGAVTSEPSTAGFVIDLGTFTGIVALISAIVTQILKVIPAISGSKLAKIGVSVAVGMVVCVLAWALQLTPLLEGYQWWGTLIYGLAAGLSGCGFYDVIKAIAALFEKNTPEME